MSNKYMGQVFTPDYIIEKLLDTVGYITNVTNKTILEPSFGDGRIIKKIIDRLINDCRQKHMTKSEIIKQIENNVYGIEMDKNLYQKTKDCIVQYVFDKLGDYADINLYCANTLNHYKFFVGNFDFIVGNPPYATTHCFSDKTFFKNFYFTKNGAADIYLAFFDAGIKMLKSNSGKLCFITPSLWMYNKTGYSMRKYITDWPILSKIIDFGHKQIFEGFTTYTSITLLDLNHNNFTLTYEKDDNLKIKRYQDLWVDNRFCFAELSDIKKYRHILNLNYNPFCVVKNGYATLCDKFFIDNDEMPDNDYMIDVCKSSTHKFYKCFYPYDNLGKIIPIDKITKNKKFFEYLWKNKVTLLNRNNISSEWYGFGRSQGIVDTYSKKFAINIIVKNVGDIQLTECGIGTGVYGGLYILSECTKEKLLSILNSDDFFKYLKSIGTLKNGGYYSITSKQLEKYLNYILLNEYIQNGTTLYTNCCGSVESVCVVEKSFDEYGVVYYCSMEYGGSEIFRFRELGQNIFLFVQDLQNTKTHT